MQTFDYSHQSAPGIDQVGGGPITIDYEHGRAPVPEGAPPMQEHDPTIPLVPYYDLPAGLMVPLVKVRMHKIWNKLIKLWKKSFCYGYHNLYTYSINKIPYQDVIGHPIFQ